MCSKTLDREEIKLFNSLAIDWWNEEGKMSVLHAMSEARMSYIRKNIIDHFEIRPNLIEAFKGLKILLLSIFLNPILFKIEMLLVANCIPYP